MERVLQVKDGNDDSKVTYEFVKKIEKNILTETSWCNDISMFENKIFENEALNFKSKLLYYNAYQRISKNTPSLKCDFKGIENTKPLKYKSNIGIITADESLFSYDSGTSFLSYKSDYYRILSMTPSYAYNGSNYPYMYGADNNITNDQNYGTRYLKNYIVPIIAVKPTVTILSNTTGTQSNPYVIE